MTKQRQINFIPTLIYFTCNYQNEYKKFDIIVNSIYWFNFKFFWLDSLSKSTLKLNFIKVALT
jgi:hypothetical protein